LGLQGAGDVPQALEVLARANERHPGNREVLAALVSMHRTQGNTEQAQRFAEELQRYFPQTSAGTENPG
jgi:Tfp pilus assembly protein PilF